LADRSDLPELLGPGVIADGVSIDELTRTVADLQSTGADTGEYGSRANRTPNNVIAADYIATRMFALGLAVRYQDFASWDGSYQVNVIGELPGEDTSKVYLVLAHYDSINADGGVAPGADDNASGVAAMLEMARILSTYQLRHPVHFLATSAEEEAMYGAIAFAKEARSAGIPYDAAFNLDSLGWADRSNEIIINGDEDTIPIQNVMASINDIFGLGQALVIRQNPGIIADDNGLRKVGIPTVLIARALYGDNPVHHTERDTLDLVDISAVKSAADLVLLTIAEYQSR
jgi:Zn-dependent M28 family amino/carboxypeptidase